MILFRSILPRRSSTRLAMRAMSSGSQAPKFDAEMTKAYAKMAENHRHPQGPWIKMLEAIQQVSPAGSSPTILDLASGPGEPAATIAKAMPSANVISTDVSEDMVATATKVTKGISNLTVALADVQDLSEYADGSIDVVTCCYGYMFPTDKVKALEETYRVLKPGGIVVATTWDRVDILTLARDVMEAVLGAPPPPPPLNPMSLSEPGLFVGMLSSAGFSNIESTTSTYPFDMGQDKDFQFRIGTMLLKDKIDEIGKEGWDNAEKAFWSNVGKYTEITTDGKMMMPQNTFRLTVAKK